MPFTAMPDDMSKDTKIVYDVVKNAEPITLNGTIAYDRTLNVHKLGDDGEWCVYRETVFSSDYDARRERDKGYEHPLSEKYGIARTKSVDVDKRTDAFEKPKRPQLIDDLRSEFRELPFTWCVSYVDKLDAVTSMNACTSPKCAITREIKGRYTGETDIDLRTAKPAYIAGNRTNYIVVGLDNVPVIIPYRFEIGFECYTYQIKDKVLRKHIEDDVASVNAQMFDAIARYAKGNSNLRRCGYSTATKNKIVYRLFPETPERQLEMFREIGKRQDIHGCIKIFDDESACIVGLNGIMDVIRPYYDMLNEFNELTKSGSLDYDLVSSIDECISIHPDRRCMRAFDATFTFGN